MNESETTSSSAPAGTPSNPGRKALSYRLPTGTDRHISGRRASSRSSDRLKECAAAHEEHPDA